MTWQSETVGVLELPSGRRIRGRSLRKSPLSTEEPTFGVYLGTAQPPEMRWETHWIPWRDFWVPRDRAQAGKILHRTWEEAAHGRVEVACNGGVGRTGTALAWLAVIDGVPADEAVDFVRSRYLPRAVETPWQRRLVTSLTE